MIRIFQFMNNFLTEDTKMVKARYSSFGYFDGLDTWQENNEAQIRKFLSFPQQAHINKDVTCDYFNIVGIRKEEAPSFWGHEEENPLLFVTFIRLKNESKKLEEIIEDIEKKYNAYCYTTFDSSDFIVCMRTKKYSEGYEVIEGYSGIVNKQDSDNGIQKSFSVCSIHQDILNKIALRSAENFIEDEKISCILNCVIQDWKRIPYFEAKLKKELNISECPGYGILGSDDRLYMLNEINISELFRLYGNGGLLTHGNEDYKAFYNIKTEILIKSGGTV